MRSQSNVGSWELLSSLLNKSVYVQGQAKFHLFTFTFSGGSDRRPNEMQHYLEKNQACIGTLLETLGIMGFYWHLNAEMFRIIPLRINLLAKVFEFIQCLLRQFFFLMQRFNFHFQEATKQHWPLVTFQYVRLLFVLYSKSFNFHCWTKAFWICHLGIFSDALQPMPAYAFKMKLVEVAVHVTFGQENLLPC